MAHEDATVLGKFPFTAGSSYASAHLPQLLEQKQAASYFLLARPALYSRTLPVSSHPRSQSTTAQPRIKKHNCWSSKTTIVGNPRLLRQSLCDLAGGHPFQSSSVGRPRWKEIWLNKFCCYQLPTQHGTVRLGLLQQLMGSQPPGTEVAVLQCLAMPRATRLEDHFRLQEVSNAWVGCKPWIIWIMWFPGPKSWVLLHSEDSWIYLSSPSSNNLWMMVSYGIYQSNFLNHNSLVSLSNLAWFNGIFHGKIQHPRVPRLAPPASCQVAMPQQPQLTPLQRALQPSPPRWQRMPGTGDCGFWMEKHGKSTIKMAL